VVGVGGSVKDGGNINPRRSPKKRSGMLQRCKNTKPKRVAVKDYPSKCLVELFLNQLYPMDLINPITLNTFSHKTHQTQIN